MKKLINFISLVLIILLLAGCSNNDTNNNSNIVSDPNYAKLSSNLNATSSNNISTNTNTNITQIHQHGHDNPTTEIEMASFSTKLNGSASPRTNNINITTGILDGTIVNPGEIFSFCNTIGKPTPERGYQEADAFDKQGHTFKAFGGGNCQVSSTLYNVVLQIPELEVTERHAHSKRVFYVEKGKDAAVATGSVDFKFKNNSDTSIKIYASSDLNSVNIRIVQLG